MRGYLFQNEEELRIALTCGLVPADHAAEPVGFTRAADGSIRVAPQKSLPAKITDGLRAAGVAVESGAPEPEAEASSWIEILQPRRQPGWEPDRGMVLFLLPEGGRAQLDLAAELLRLGCDRQELAFSATGAALIRAVDPPYYTVAVAVDRPGGLRAFQATPPGQDQVWTEVGHAHPLITGVRPPAGRLLLVKGDGVWLTLDNGPWIDLYKMMELRLPGAPVALKATAPPRTLTVPLRLARAPREQTPQLWVLRENAIAAVDQLVQTLPNEVAGRLSFAVADQNMVVLRARTSQKGAPEIVLTAEAYAPLLTIPNLYAPSGAVVEPPLRREKLRELLAPSAEHVAWLAPASEHGPNGFRVERIAEQAFSPLTDWIEYLVHTSAAKLEPWVRSAVFEFESFESTGGEWADDERDSPAERAERKGKEKGKKERGGRADASYKPTPAPSAKAEEKAPEYVPEPQLRETKKSPTEKLEKQLGEIERAYLDLDAPVDDPARNMMWRSMGDLNVSLGRGRDVGLCYTRSLWELGDAKARPAVVAWVEAEARLRNTAPDRMVAAMLALRTPTRDEVRALTSQIVHTALAAPKAVPFDLHRVQVWLDQNDDNLDIRSLWLARAALAKLVGGDRLQLARTRDRVLAKLARGLSLERDVPTFLRFLAGGAGVGADAAAATALVAELEALVTRMEKTERKRTPIDDKPALTRAYAAFVLAYGFARLGQTERARKLRDAAGKALDQEDPIHAFLSRAYAARIDQALEGLRSETPLPTPIAAMLDKLVGPLRFKVDRLRQASSILEPQERLEPFTAFQSKEKDPRGAEFAGMRSIEDMAELSRAVGGLMTRAGNEGPEERARLYDGLMDFFPVIPEAQAIPHLQTILGKVKDVPPARRALLLEEALMLAGYFGREEIVKEIVRTLKGLLGSLGSEEAAEAGKVFGGCLRGLRRVGLREEAAELLAGMGHAVTGKGVAAIVGRLQIAGGLASLGHLADAAPSFDEARTALKDKTLTMSDRLAITRALASSLSSTPKDQAIPEIGKLAEQLPTITDSYSTNSHFCLSVIHFIESLVLGYASEDLSLGEVGKRWLEEDEYLVRRRMHRDLAGGEERDA